MVALVHNHQGRELVDNLEKRGIIRLFDGLLGFAQGLCHGRQAAVLPVGFQGLIAAAPERIIGQHHNGKLLGNGGYVEILAAQKLLLGVHHYPPAKGHVNGLPVGVAGVLQAFEGLGQNGV